MGLFRAIGRALLAPAKQMAGVMKQQYSRKPPRERLSDMTDSEIDELADKMFWEGAEIEDNPFPYNSHEAIVWQNSFESTIVTNYGEEALEDYYNGDRGFGSDPYGKGR